MQIIYEPKGKAREYAALALNIYKGCTHGCRYCYGPNASRTKAEAYWLYANPKTDVINKLKKDCIKLAGTDCPEILVSFLGDPYQPAERHYCLTQQAIFLLMQYKLPFSILTKGGYRAIRDFHFLQGYPNVRFGTSLSMCLKEDVEIWEPKAPSFKERVRTIERAKYFGLTTWVSLEPVIDPKQALYIIEQYDYVVDHWKVGKINHFPEIEKIVDWVKFRQDVTALLDSLGASYYLKESLRSL